MFWLIGANWSSNLNDVLSSSLRTRLTLLLSLCAHTTGPASVLREGPMGAQLPTAVLLMSWPGVCRAPTPHHRSLLFPSGEAQAQLSWAQTHLSLRRSLQVSRSGVTVTRWLFFFFFSHSLHSSSSSTSLLTCLWKKPRAAHLLSLIIYVLAIGRRDQ